MVSCDTPNALAKLRREHPLLASKWMVSRSSTVSLRGRGR
jgi:hypothetical protein